MLRFAVVVTSRLRVVNTWDTNDFFRLTTGAGCSRGKRLYGELKKLSHGGEFPSSLYTGLADCCIHASSHVGCF